MRTQTTHRHPRSARAAQRWEMMLPKSQLCSSGAGYVDCANTHIMSTLSTKSCALSHSALKSVFLYNKHDKNLMMKWWCDDNFFPPRLQLHQLKCVSLCLRADWLRNAVLRLHTDWSDQRQTLLEVFPLPLDWDKKRTHKLRFSIWNCTRVKHTGQGYSFYPSGDLPHSLTVSVAWLNPR